MKKRGRNYESYINPKNLLKMLTRSSSRYVSDKPKDGKPIKYGVACKRLSRSAGSGCLTHPCDEVFTRKAEAKALRNKLNGSCGGGFYHVITLGK